MTVANNYQIDRHTRKSHSAAFSKMEAISCGVRARLEENTGYSKKVTDETINVARSLGVADSEIERWATHHLSRLAQDTERLREIKSLLDKVYGNRFGVMTQRARS